MTNDNIIIIVIGIICICLVISSIITLVIKTQKSNTLPVVSSGKVIIVDSVTKLINKEINKGETVNETFTTSIILGKDVTIDIDIVLNGKTTEYRNLKGNNLKIDDFDSVTYIKVY